MMYLPLEMACFVEATGPADALDTLLASVRERVAMYPDGRTILPFWNWIDVRSERPEPDRATIQFFMTTRRFAAEAVPCVQALAESHPRLTLFFYGDYYEAGWGQRALLDKGQMVVWDRFEVDDDMLPEARGIRNVRRLHGDGSGIPPEYEPHFDPDGDLVPDWDVVRRQVEAAGRSKDGGLVPRGGASEDHHRGPQNAGNAGDNAVKEGPSIGTGGGDDE